VGLYCILIWRFAFSYIDLCDCHWLIKGYLLAYLLTCSRLPEQSVGCWQCWQEQIRGTGEYRATEFQHCSVTSSACRHRSGVSTSQSALSRRRPWFLPNTSPAVLLSLLRVWSEWSRHCPQIWAAGARWSRQHLNCWCRRNHLPTACVHTQPIITKQKCHWIQPSWSVGDTRIVK